MMYATPFTEHNQIRLLALGYSWLGGESWIHPIERQFIHIDTEDKVLVYRDYRKFEGYTWEPTIVHECLREGYVIKEVGSFRFIQFTDTLDVPELYEQWKNWINNTEELE